MHDIIAFVKLTGITRDINIEHFAFPSSLRDGDQLITSFPSPVVLLICVYKSLFRSFISLELDIDHLSGLSDILQHVHDFTHRSLMGVRRWLSQEVPCSDGLGLQLSLLNVM